MDYTFEDYAAVEVLEHMLIEAQSGKPPTPTQVHDMLIFVRSIKARMGREIADGMDGIGLSRGRNSR